MKENKLAQEKLLTVYKEVCASYHAVDDFRAKLLALLPIASGSGGIFLLKNKTQLHNHFVFIGLLGLIVTLGLFFYELRGIENCGRFITVGKSLEKDLGMKNGMFCGCPPIENKAYGFISAPTASWTVYLSVMAGWGYLIHIGASSCG